MGREGPLLGDAFEDCSPCYVLLLVGLAAGLEFISSEGGS